MKENRLVKKHWKGMDNGKKTEKAVVADPDNCAWIFNHYTGRNSAFDAYVF